MTTAPEKPIIALGPWLETEAGSYVRRWEQARLDALTVDIFGFNALQLGLPQIAALRANRMQSRILTDTHLPADVKTEQVESSEAPESASSLELPQAVVIHDFAELPFASQSLDLVVLPHVLEFADEPHQILREVERVLIPEGQVIICGFNPTSLWGLRQAAGRLTGAHFLPQDGEFIGLLRLKDWLKLLNMEINRGHFGCYAPPFNTEKWLHRFAFMEKAGDRWWPYFGAVYIVQAIKRVNGMRLIGPAWKGRKAKAGQGVPVANKIPELGACEVERVEAKWVGKEPNLSPILRTVAVARAGKTGAKWDFSPSMAADSLLPRRLLWQHRSLNIRNDHGKS